MKKTSMYLSEGDRDRLERLAKREGRSKAAILREALAEYEAKHRRPRTSALAGKFSSDQKPVSQMTPEELDELMRGFGQ